MDFDGGTPVKDFDSAGFRESRIPAVKTALSTKVTELGTTLKDGTPDKTKGFLVNSSDDLARIVLDADPQEDISATEQTAIVHALGLTIWDRPKNAGALERTLVDALVATHLQGIPPNYDRAAKGTYFLEVLLHKYKDGNGRVARGMKLLLDKAGTTDGVTDDEVKQVLGLGREALTQTGETSFQINFNPDFQRLILGVAHFATTRGLADDVIVNELKLNGSLPEQGLEKLAQKLGVQKEGLKQDFIRFMVVDSDLSWCNFDGDQAAKAKV